MVCRENDCNAVRRLFTRKGGQLLPRPDNAPTPVSRLGAGSAQSRAMIDRYSSQLTRSPSSSRNEVRGLRLRAFSMSWHCRDLLVSELKFSTDRPAVQSKFPRLL